MLLFDPQATRLLQRCALLALVEHPPFPPLHLLLVDLGAVSARDPDGDALRYGIVFGDRERFEVGKRDGVVRYVQAHAALPAGSLPYQRSLREG